MGKTFKKQSSKYEEDNPSSRRGKHSKHSNGKKTSGMRTLNSYADEDYEPFDDDIELSDEIFIEHIQDDKQ